jgi:hypothetical protein
LNTDDSTFSGEGGTADNKVVVEPRVKSDVPYVKGGLVLDGCGKVVSIGAEVTAVRPGDAVTFDPTAGQDVLLFGKLLKILKESEVSPATARES